MFHVLCTSSFLSLISSAFPFSLIGSVLKQFSSIANRTICFCLSVRCDGKKFHYVCMVNNTRINDCKSLAYNTSEPYLL